MKKQCNRNRKLRRQSGFTLIEIIFSIAILTMGMLGLLSVIPYQMTAFYHANQTIHAKELAEKGLNKYRAMDFDAVMEGYPDETFAREIKGYGFDPGDPAYFGLGDIPKYKEYKRTISIYRGFPKENMCTVIVEVNWYKPPFLRGQAPGDDEFRVVMSTYLTEGIYKGNVYTRE